MVVNCSISLRQRCFALKLLLRHRGGRAHDERSLRLNQELNLTVLLVEQKLPFARRVAERFAVLDKGRPVAGGNIDELSDELVSEHLSV